MICPILYPVGDQQFWGNLAYKMDLAVEPIPIRKMTEDIFVSSAEKLLNNPVLQENARKMQLKIDMENGTLRTIDEIEKYASGL